MTRRPFLRFLDWCDDHTPNWVAALLVACLYAYLLAYFLS